MPTRSKTIDYLLTLKGMIYRNLKISALMLLLVGVSFAGRAQHETGELESREIVIEKVREITLRKANRNFEKIPPRPAENIKAPMTYDFQSFSFQAPQVTT